MKRRVFICTSLGFTLGTWPLKEVLIAQEGNSATDKVLSYMDFPIPQKVSGVSETFEAEILIIDNQRQKLRLNESGRFLWEHIDSKTCTDQLATLLAEKYRIDPEKAAVDVDLFVYRLGKEGFLEVLNFSQRVIVERSIQK